MMVVPTENSIILAATASLLGEGGGETDSLKAWAERHIRLDPDLRWVLGNYVEADNANDNGHIFPRGDLVTAQATLAGKPLNMMHREHYIVGYFAGAQLLHADGGNYDPELVAKNGNPPPPSFYKDPEWKATAAAEQPYMEALAGMWHNRFPEEFFQIKKAHSEGSLFFSMEAIPESVSCPTCEHTSVYAGLSSEKYCEHMNGSTGPKRLHNPTFNGGAIIIPPVRPGWQRADIKEISKLMESSTAESVYAQVSDEAPHLAPADWEALMAQVLKVTDKEFPPAFRKKLAEKKKALPDGGFPIENAADLKNAIKAIGRAKDPAAAKAHIKRRAKALGLEKLIPPGW